MQQALTSARCPAVSGPIALMPDAHWGMGATVGSVIPTESAIIPAAVGVDIGCGMIAVETDLDASHLPDNLGPILRGIGKTIPAGFNRHYKAQNMAIDWLAANIAIFSTSFDVQLVEVPSEVLAMLRAGAARLDGATADAASSGLPAG